MPKRLWIGMVILGACARLAPHPWNFTPMMALALFAGSQARKLGAGVLVTLIALALSDAVLGFYQGFWFVYAAALVPVVLGNLIASGTGPSRLSSGPESASHPAAKSIALAASASSLSFFVITNFMVWVTSSMYPHTAAGLATCFTAAIPFYRNELLGDAFYTVALFGGYALIRSRLEPAPQTA
jgi:hypothetical protein